MKTLASDSRNSLISAVSARKKTLASAYMTLAFDLSASKIMGNGYAQTRV